MSEGHIAPPRVEWLLYGRGTGGEPLFVGVSRRGEGWNLSYVGFVAGFFAAPYSSGTLALMKGLSRVRGTCSNFAEVKLRGRPGELCLPLIPRRLILIVSPRQTVTISRFASHVAVKTIHEQCGARAV